jgi:hypothetical protein
MTRTVIHGRKIIPVQAADKAQMCWTLSLNLSSVMQPNPLVSIMATKFPEVL